MMVKRFSDQLGCSIWPQQEQREGHRNPPAAEAIEIDRCQALRFKREHRTEGGRAAMARDDATDLSPGNVLKA